MMLKAKRALVVILLMLLLAGCQPDGREPIALSEQDQAAAEQTLYPRFDLAHAAPRELSPELQQKLDQILQSLSPEAEQGADHTGFKLVVTAEPDADAGCIAGGRLFISEGMLAWVHNADEMAGVLAMALQQCPRASRLWREREDMRLVEFDDQSELMNRYIDYRLDANASLFNQLVTSGCDEGDCLSVVSDQLTAAGYDQQAAAKLHARIQKDWPESAWLERVGLASGPVSNGSVDAEWAALLRDYSEKRSGLGDFADVRRQISRGRLGLAYRASLSARKALGKTYETELMQAELDLHNKHGFYSRDILRDMEQKYGEIAHASYYWGWVHAQEKERDLALEQLASSIDILPKVSAHHYLAREMILENDHEQAMLHLNHALEAGQHHRLYERTSFYINHIQPEEN